MLYGNIKADICSSRGIFNGDDALKLILSGATAVQVVSSVYKYGVERIATIKNDITEWMQQKGYNSLDEFRGKLANCNLDKNEHSLVYKRAQYVDLMLTSDTIFGNFQ